MSGLDQVIDLIVGDIETAEKPLQWLAAQGAVNRAIIETKAARMPKWTPEEDQFLRENRPYMSLDEIGSQLGRTLTAVRIRSKRIGAISPRHAPRYISCNQLAKILGVDNHAPPNWVDRGIIQGEAFPYDPSGPLKRRVQIEVFKRWLIKPTSWVYFKVKNITIPHYRRLVELAQERWGDEWWTTRQAANYLGCDPKTILHNIQRGRIYGYHSLGLDRRRNQRWAYWFVWRSEIEKFQLPSKRDSRLKFTARADEFMLKARIEWGYPPAIIARLMKFSGSYKTIDYRIRLLCRQRGIALDSLSGKTKNFYKTVAVFPRKRRDDD